MKYFIIWKTDNSYYYKLSKMTYKKYYVGYKNRYKHEVIMIIPFKIIKFSFFKKISMSFLKFLKKLVNFLERRL